MEDTKPVWPKWALFFVGVLALVAVGYGMGFVPLFRGPLGYVALFVWFMVFLAYTYFGSARLKADRLGPIMKRYRRRLAIAMISYCVVLLGSLGLLRGSRLSGVLLWIVAAAPAIPILGVLVVMGLYLKEEPDEFERAVHVESMLWGLGAVLAVTTVWGFLSNASVIPQPPLFLVFPLFCLSWGVSQPLIRRRYQ
ncbi:MULTISPECIES: hypothetical protein [unclassified Caulobacter]|uniref:hypothetical protein n=1 Tax=unclassified Caulobacter TaxID=2648921 RepID=UPI0006F6933E|nr:MULTISPECIES: hypothetical protein [unclassified Caulobacter]KQV56616.1 hypothetical protein ASC62_09815 [Caulobacter sp. Root342]KQV72253.1 hypothetical protein ASC70_00765 [Caulobacter sp. Root343]